MLRVHCKQGRACWTTRGSEQYEISVMVLDRVSLPLHLVMLRALVATSALNGYRHVTRVVAVGNPLLE